MLSELIDVVGGRIVARHRVEGRLVNDASESKQINPEWTKIYGEMRALEAKEDSLSTVEIRHRSEPDSERNVALRKIRAQIGQLRDKLSRVKKFTDADSSRIKTVDQIYKGFMIYKSGKAPAEFTAIKENLQYQGSKDEVYRQIDKYWEEEDARVVSRNTSDAKKKVFVVVNNEFNRANYKDLIGKEFDSPPAYAQVKVVEKEHTSDKRRWHPRWKIKGDRRSVKDSEDLFDVRNIEKDSKANNDFRRVLFTADRLQLVLMCLNPGEEIGEEVHPETDQFFRIEEGRGKAVLNGKEIFIQDGTTIVVKAGCVHNIINNSDASLKLYSLYSPPHHQEGLIEENKSDETF
jgi:mannose-6-phosphate isomerase-like protein (cupin superfamily)